MINKVKVQKDEDEKIDVILEHIKIIDDFDGQQYYRNVDILWNIENE